MNPERRITVRADTRKQARALARLMLGPYAQVRVRPGRCQVGHYLEPLRFKVVGEGKSWAEALTQAQAWGAEWFEEQARRSLEAEPPAK